MSRENRIGFGLLTATLLWSLALALAGSTEALLYLAPTLLIALPLAFGRYPGERVLEQLRTRFRRERPRAADVPAPAPAAAHPLPRGGRLIAAGLARRGPPATVTA